MAAVSQFFNMTTQQQQVEKIWYFALKELALGKDFTELVISSEAMASIGKDGVAAIAQRCSAFHNAQVEVMDDAMTDTVRIQVLAPGSLMHSADIAGGASPGSSIDTKKKESKTPRPPNSFILYRQHHHPTLVAQNPGMHNNQISQLIGKKWKSEPQSVRDDWKRKAEEVKVKHAKDHPDYQYQPRKPAEKKRRMTKRKAEDLAAAAAAVAQPVAQTSTDTAQQTVPGVTFNDIVNLNGMIFTNEAAADPFEMPSFNFSADGQAATFTFDPAQENQIELFNEMLEGHNALTTAPAPAELNAPAATTSLPTVAHNNQYSFDMTSDEIAAAQAGFFSFEESLESQLMKELEMLEEQQNSHEVPQGYNGAEAQRFTDFLNQMPSHMWGMEFVEYP